MKKKYTTPLTECIDVDPQLPVCGSGNGQSKIQVYDGEEEEGGDYAESSQLRSSLWGN